VPQKSDNVVWAKTLVSAEDRARLLRQQGCVLWLTGLSGSGKSTVAQGLERKLVSEGQLAYVLDGDNVRHGLNGDLGFSAEDRKENIRRIGEVAALFADAGLITIVSFISPYRAGRDRARQAAPENRFLEIHVHAPLEICEERDPKGLYKRARAGELADFTGVNAPYEEPESPELRLDTSRIPPADCVEIITASLRERGLLEPPTRRP
jgi:adenylylsulfate kinase